MPHSASEVESSAFLRLLVLGGPKVGKTYTTITTTPGPGYVINSDDKFSLKPAARVKGDFEWDLCLGDELQSIENAIRAARVGVQEGRYKWVIWDTITKYAMRVEDVFADATKNAKGEPDGRRYWREYRKHLDSVIDRLFTLKCHVIVNAHFVEVSGATIDGQIDKSGQGVVPLLAGQARTTVPAAFQDVVFLEKKSDARFFVTSSDGIFGPGCRSLPGVSSVEASIEVLWAKMNGQNKKKVKEK